MTKTNVVSSKKPNKTDDKDQPASKAFEEMATDFIQAERDVHSGTTEPTLTSLTSLQSLAPKKSCLKIKTNDQEDSCEMAETLTFPPEGQGSKA